MITSKNCPTCGTEFSASAADGFCLKCLGKLAFSDQDPGGKISEMRRLGDYELLEEIARGGMGVVYRARQLSLNRIVAVKVVLSGPFSSHEFVLRFQTEAEAAAALRHPNIVAIYEVGECNGQHFLSMEYVEGESFAGLVREQPLPARRAAGYLQILAGALQHAHERGVLHRDLKPSNILLDVFDQPRVTDFGLAKLRCRAAEVTIPGSVLGSPNYIPPEQAAGDASKIAPHSDVYSLGAILYQLLTGRPPFQGETLHEILHQVQGAEPVPPGKLNPSVPPDLQTICLKCLQKEPARRYATARELAEDLQLFLAGKPIRSHPVSFVEATWLWCKRRPALAMLTLALLIAVAGGLAGVLYEWQRANLHARGEMQQRLVAETNAAITRLNLYAANVALAAQAMQQGNFGLARRTLEQMRPRPGETDLRGFEWRYLWHECQGQQLATLGRHEWIVTCVAFSPDGKMIASGGMGGQVKIWDVGKRECRQTLDVTTGAVWSLAFTPDNRTLMVGSTSNGVQFRGTDTWSVVADFPGRIAALSGDGALLAVSESSRFFYDPAGRVTLWNRRTGQPLRTLAEPGRALALSPDGVFLAVATKTNGARLYETASGKMLRYLPSRRPVWSLRFSPDNRELLSAGWSGEVSLWKIPGDSAPRIFSANFLNVWDAEFSPDGKTIATTSSDQTVRFWDRATLEPENVLHGHDSEVWCAAFRPDGSELVSGGKDHNVLLWSAALPNGQKKVLHENACVPVFSPDGTQLVTVNTGTNTAYALWSATNRVLLAPELAHQHIIAGFAPGGNFLVALTGDRRALEFWPPLASAPERTVILQELPAGKNDFVFWGMSPEREFFFATDDSGTVRVWNIETGALEKKVSGPLPPIRNTVLSSHANFLAICVERQNEFYLYDLVRGKDWLVRGHSDFVSALAFSPKGSTLATGGMDGTIRLWQTADAKSAGFLPGHLEETSDLAISSDGRTLASVGQKESLKLWHLPTLREVYSEPLPHAGRHLQFSPDGRRLAVNTDEDKLLLLEAP